MATYSASYSPEIRDIIKNNLTPKERSMLKKSIAVTLENPYHGAATVKGRTNKTWRRHVCADKYRLLYGVEEGPNKKVHFYILLMKNKKTYK